MAGHAHAQSHNTPVLQLYCGCRIILSRGVRLKKKKKKKKYHGQEITWAFHVAFHSLGFSYDSL